MEFLEAGLSASEYTYLLTMADIGEEEIDQKKCGKFTKIFEKSCMSNVHIAVAAIAIDYSLKKIGSTTKLLSDSWLEIAVICLPGLAIRSVQLLASDEKSLANRISKLTGPLSKLVMAVSAVAMIYFGSPVFGIVTLGWLAYDLAIENKKVPKGMIKYIALLRCGSVIAVPIMRKASMTEILSRIGIIICRLLMKFPLSRG